MTHPTQEDDVKVNDIACLPINYDVEGWRKLTKGFTLPTVLPGAILAIDSLCDEVEQLRARLEQAERDAEAQRSMFANLCDEVADDVIEAMRREGETDEDYMKSVVASARVCAEEIRDGHSYRGDAHIAAIASEVKA